VLFVCVTCCTLFSCRGKVNQNKTTVVNRSARTRQKKKTASSCMSTDNVSTLGLGLIVPPDRFAVFNDSLLTNKMADVDIYNDNANYSPVCSMFFYPDYGIMHFICLKRTKRYYEVLNGYSDIKYLPATKSYHFLPWDKYILQSMGIRRKNDLIGEISSRQPLRKEPNSPDTLSIPKGYELFCAIRVKGDWLQVTYDCFYNEEDNKYEGEPCSSYIKKCTNPLTCWLKWKDGNKLLIDILLTD